MTRAALTMVSTNKKTGPMPVSSSDRASCPPSCALKADGCYGEDYRTRLHWDAITAGARGDDWGTFCAKVATIPAGRLWRHDVVGDLPHDDGAIDPVALGQLVAANKGRRGFTFTHHLPEAADNARWIGAANAWGFTVNLSANNLTEADRLASFACGPVVCLLPADQRTNTVTPEGRRVVICPHETHGVQCIDCGLCARPDREVVIGFPAHGQRAKRAERVFWMGAA